MLRWAISRSSSLSSSSNLATYHVGWPKLRALTFVNDVCCANNTRHLRYFSTKPDDSSEIATENSKKQDSTTTSELDVQNAQADTLQDMAMRVRALPSASVSNIDPSLLAFTDKASWLPARRQRTPLPPGLPEKAVEMIQRFEMTLKTPIHEDTSRILALPKKLGGFGFKELTLVQESTIKPIAQGLDVLVRAPTGTGKTLAYLIPVLERLLYMRANPDAKAIPVLILCPSRELALQTAATITHLLGLHARHADRSYGVTCVVGGTSSTHVEQEPLQQDMAAFLVGTPGRIHDHIRNTPGFKRRLAGTRIVVLDEVDFLLRSCLSSDLAGIMAAVNSKRQTIMFSATLNKSVRTVAQYSLRAGHQVIDLIRDSDGPVAAPAATGAPVSADAALLHPARAASARDPDIIPLDEADISDGEVSADDAEGLQRALALADEETDEELELYAATPKGAEQYIVGCSAGDALPVITRIADDIAGRYAYALAVWHDQQEAAKDIGNDVLVNEKPKPPKILVFAPTARYAQFAALTLRKVVNAGKQGAYEAVLELHSKKNQNYRVRVAQQFAGDSWERGVIMCSSDVAARGIDFKDVDLVVQIGAPNSRAQYIQRVGRTARAGSKGISLLLVDHADVPRTKQMLSNLPLGAPDYDSLMLDYNDALSLEEIYPEQETEQERKKREKLERKEAEERAAAEALRRERLLREHMEETFYGVVSRGDAREIAVKESRESEVLDTEATDGETDGEQTERDMAASLQAREAELLREWDSESEDMDVSKLGRASSAVGEHAKGEAEDLAGVEEVEEEVEEEEGEEEGEELWDGVIARACAPLMLVHAPEAVREKRFKTLWGQTMCVRAVSAVDRYNTYEYMLQRVLRKVPHDDELGLNAERAYVSMLGLWRMANSSAGSKKTELKKGLDSVTDSAVLTPQETGKRAAELAQALGLCGAYGELPTPNVPERVAKRLGLVGVPGISVGQPREYVTSAKEAQLPKDKGYVGKKAPAPFREYSRKQSSFKTRPVRLRTGELMHKINEHTTNG